ncbi:MAG: LPS-assembly protein LptD [Rhodospirillales bacterium]|nr:LPS-assembly protein LptD [Rhodospirillales bacterium]
MPVGWILAILLLAAPLPGAAARAAGAASAAPDASAIAASTLATPPPPGNARKSPGTASGKPAGPNAVTSPVKGSQGPVTFTADRVEYDQAHSLVTASGHVEAWQNGRVLHADTITFDRTTGVVAAHGHVVLQDPDGEVMFADYAELDQGMKDGVLSGMRALLAQNGRLAANGARREAGKLNELSKVVYSTCNICAKHPNRPPLWELRAASAVQDLEHKKIEYTDATMDILGVPVAYFPYFWHVDPSVKRASGLLIPSFGYSSHIGAFFAQPYYWVINDQSDATFTPMITSRAGPNLDVRYRRRFNNGYLTADGSLGYLDNSPQGTLYLNGQFDYDQNWRWGFNINRASSSTYINDFHLSHDLGSDINLLTSQIYVEGFGQGAYTRLDTRFYQGINSTIVDSELPVVLPRYQYSFFGTPDFLGGRTSLDVGAFNVLRTVGTNTRRANLTWEWDRPFTGRLGDLWTAKLHLDAAGYDASHFNEQPNYGPTDTVNTARALPQAALDWRWPFMRNSGSWGTQIIEPMAELIVAPQAGDSQNQLYPNEDSLDLEFTDANLFGFNRFTGIDRLEGGSRANLALHGAWYLDGTALDGLIGQSYQPTPNNVMPVGSGLHGTVSDVVGRLSFTPTPWLDLTYRTRLDHKSLATRFADATAAVGNSRFQVTGGYIYTTTNPFSLYDQAYPPPVGSAYYFPRNEASLGFSTRFGQYRFNAYARRDLATNKMVAIGGDAVYENECLIVDLHLYRRYTSFDGDNGSTTVLLQLTFKTVGQLGFNAL